MKMLQRAAAESHGKSIPVIGAFGGSGDTLAALRGTDQLLLDCVERPDEVRTADEFLMDLWFDFYDRSYRIVHEAAGGSTCWFGLWSPGKFYASQNDFSYNIGPEMFRELFLPAIRQQTEFLDHTVYHVDGVGAFGHVDALCELPKLQAIQILPGAGKPSPLHYMSVLRKVQAAGKNLHIRLPQRKWRPLCGNFRLGDFSFTPGRGRKTKRGICCNKRRNGPWIAGSEMQRALASFEVIQRVATN